jgi:hypothetical protein
MLVWYRIVIKKEGSSFRSHIQFLWVTLHLWYCKLLPVIAGFFFKKATKIKRVMGSLLFDQMLFSPIFYCGYFIMDAIV